MLNSLEIRNYRNIKHLTINKLSRVNLFVGKNNTSKTSVLEALAIYINRANVNFILQLLDERGENYIRAERSLSERVLQEKPILKTLSAIFSNRIPVFTEEAGIVIGELETPLSGLQPSQSRMAIRFVRYVEGFEESSPEQPAKRRTLVEVDNDDLNTLIGLEIKYGGSSVTIPLVSEWFFPRIGANGFAVWDDRMENYMKDYQFVRTKNIDRDINGSLWDSISLTEREDDVVNALRIIESKTERITFRTERERERVAVIKLQSSSEVIPLRSMGDGINRVLTIILAMVNCQGGYLLIDEFENGLHFSVQEQLWKIIFHLAEQLNIQVFATTHSSDAVSSFATVLSDQILPDEAGHIIRFQHFQGSVIAVDYTAEELQAAIEYGIEIRG
jgi:AAA domain, putative AbiEii toxin, Type IV TA system/AAA ATPase domain